MNAIQAYILAKKLAEESASGISSIAYEDGKLVFQLTSGDPLEVPVPMPKDGISVESIEIREGHLWCTLSDKSEIDAGEVAGGEGGLVQVATYSELLSPGSKTDLYITTDTNDVYYWNGEKYQQILSSPSGTTEWTTF